MTVSTNARCFIVAAMLVVSVVAVGCEEKRNGNPPGATGGSAPSSGTGGKGTGGQTPPGTGGGPGTGGAPAPGMGGAGGGQMGGGGTSVGGTPGQGGQGGGVGGSAGGAAGAGGGGGSAVACTVPGTQPLYVAPGCGANTPTPMCILNYLCLGSACSCDGKIINGCNAFAVPYAYAYPLGTMLGAGSCNPDGPPR